MKLFSIKLYNSTTYIIEQLIKYFIFLHLQKWTLLFTDRQQLAVLKIPNTDVHLTFIQLMNILTLLKLLLIEI